MDEDGERLAAMLREEGFTEFYIREEPFGPKGPQYNIFAGKVAPSGVFVWGMYGIPFAMLRESGGILLDRIIVNRLKEAWEKAGE